jgi:hypothetical protein
MGTTPQICFQCNLTLPAQSARRRAQKYLPNLQTITVSWPVCQEMLRCARGRALSKERKGFDIERLFSYNSQTATDAKQGFL